MSNVTDVCSVLNDVIKDSVVCLDFGKERLHDEESKKQWARNQEAYVNYLDGSLTRLRQVYKGVPKDKSYYEAYARLIKDVMGEMGTILEFQQDLTQPQMLERIEMLLSLVYCIFSGCFGLGSMCLFKSEFPLTPDDMSMYMEMKAKEKQTHRSFN